MKKIADLTDEELISMIKDGNDLAESEIFNRYKDLVTKICRGYFIVGGDLEDLVQEGMIGLYKAIQTYDTSSDVKFGTFAYLCVKRQVQQAVRSSLSNKNAPLSNYLSIDSHGAISVGTYDEEDSENEFCIPSDSPSPEDNLIKKETMTELNNKIRSVLSDYEYRVLTLYLKGYSYKQISLLLDKNTKSVDNAIERIKDKLEFLIN